mmetsp:Transcript_87097/g.281219  ORF Transcript_87097/g.281219 Transcript_87097/m.281219 type:complete len:80 (-) Transcript_87097:20-259(-)
MAVVFKVALILASISALAPVQVLGAQRDLAACQMHCGALPAKCVLFGHPVNGHCCCCGERTPDEPGANCLCAHCEMGRL